MSQAVAWFITPHGFGHTTRTIAVMGALRKRRPDLIFDVFSTVPAWLFEGLDPIRFHDIECDVGLAQKSALEVDFEATLTRLKRSPIFDPRMIDILKQEVRTHQCSLVYCDIAPLGIAVAGAAQIPAVLVENFTWDWIYEGYLHQEPHLKPYIRRLAAVYRHADHHIQMHPPGRPAEHARQVDLVVRPNSWDRDSIRADLGLSDNQPMVLITMGGLSQNLAFLEVLGDHPETRFLIPGAEATAAAPGNVTFVPHDGSQYHPDLVLAADAVIGKLGYSTVAEVAQAGVPFGFIQRDAFRESPILAQFVQQHLPSLPIAESDFHNGAWLQDLPDLLAQPRRPYAHTHGADQITDLLMDLL